jgi:two-component system, OmpR family, KDP operon response regulator KdpE
VLLDMQLPDMDGFELVRKVRAVSRVPIIVVSVRSGEQDKVSALELGADDYLTKPYGIGELLARIRTGLKHRLQEQGLRAQYRHEDLTVDLVRRKVCVGDKEIHLSQKEADVLFYLVEHAGLVVTHHQILRDVWGVAQEEDVQYLRVYIRQLRQKLEPDPNLPRHLLTEPGVGYRMADDTNAHSEGLDGG